MFFFLQQAYVFHSPSPAEHALGRMLCDLALLDEGAINCGSCAVLRKTDVHARDNADKHSLLRWRDAAAASIVFLLGI